MFLSRGIWKCEVPIKKDNHSYQLFELDLTLNFQLCFQFQLQLSREGKDGKKGDI